MKLIVGLGNPGKEYEKTRHNIGFNVLDLLADKYNITFSENKKFNALEASFNLKGEKVLLVKPLTFMNLSGDSVIKYMNYYDINIDDLLVIHDDLDMEIAKIKLKETGSSGGHNGIKNIILNLGSRDFLRLKIGISKATLGDTKDYVLGKFTLEELNIINNSFKELSSFINDYIAMDRDRLIGKYNSRR